MGSAKAARNEEGMKGQCTNTICWFKSRKVLIAGKLKTRDNATTWHTTLIILAFLQLAFHHVKWRHLCEALKGFYCAVEEERAIDRGWGGWGGTGGTGGTGGICAVLRAGLWCHVSQ